MAIDDIHFKDAWIISPKRTMSAHGLSMQLKFARRLNQKEGVSTSTSSNNNRSCQSKTYISDILGIISPKQVMPRNLRRCPADARRRQGVHPTPWQAAKCCACHEICAGAQPTPDDARAYIRPLGIRPLGKQRACWRCCVSDVVCGMLRE